MTVEDPVRLDFRSSLADVVLFGISDLPGDEVFLATGGGVLRLAGTGDLLSVDAAGLEDFRLNSGLDLL